LLASRYTTVERDGLFGSGVGNGGAIRVDVVGMKISLSVSPSEAILSDMAALLMK